MIRFVQYRLVKGEMVLCNADTGKVLEGKEKEKANDFLIPSQYKIPSIP